MRREVGHLILARSVYRSMVAIHGAMARGDQTQARAGLDAVVAGIRPVIPELEALIAAERQTTEARDRTQRTLAPFFAREPRPDLHASNDHQAAPPEPGPMLA